jgi:hypothetical protein
MCRRSILTIGPSQIGKEHVRKVPLFAILLLVAVQASAQGTISPSNPVVNMGAQLQFTCTGGSCGTSPVFTCAGTDSSGNATTCAGSITSGGLYTAPAIVTAQQTLGGFQLLPNNHIFNTRIDGLSLNANNGSWRARTYFGGGMYGVDAWSGKNFNYVTNSTPTESMSFYYTPANNGTFTVPQWPVAKLEGGWFPARYGKSTVDDHHFLILNTQTGVMSDFYQYYPGVATTAANVTANVATLTLPLDPIKNIFVSGESVCVGSFTGADTFFNVCPVTLTGATISGASSTVTYALTHANASATSNGSVTTNTFTGGCSTAGTCTSTSGVKYNYSDYALPPIATDAAGMFLPPLIPRLQELERALATGGTINHAIRITYGVAGICNCFIWPATTSSFTGGPGGLPFGGRARLQASYDISGFSPIAQILGTQLKQYGVISADGGLYWDSDGEQTAWPSAYISAFLEINGAHKSFTITNTAASGGVATVTAANDFVGNQTQTTITGTTNGGGVFNVSNVLVTSATSTQFTFALAGTITSAADSGTAISPLINYMEYVDHSGLQVAANQTCPTPSLCGLTTRNREIVTYTSSTGSVNVDVALQGVAVNFPDDYINVMAGTPSIQLPVFVNIGTVTWSMSPSVGSLTSGGVYLAPATVGAATTTTITATSTTNPSVAAQLNVTIFPQQAIRIIPSNQASNYTDSFGNVWYGWTNGFTFLNQPGTLFGSKACNNPPAVVDRTLFLCQMGDNFENFSGETRANFLVPNGSYQITYRLGTEQVSGVQQTKASSQGLLFFSGDMPALAGGINKIFSLVSTNATVTDNHLSFVLWGVNNGAPLSSLSIIPGGVGSQPGRLP